MDSITIKPIGVIHSPYKDRVPRPSDITYESKGQIEIFPEYADGLTDLDGFSHIEVIFYFHLSKTTSLKAHPPMDTRERGVFASHSPRRPSLTGLTVVRLDSIENNILDVSGVDMIEGTPVLDIKPYIPRVKSTEKIRLGWLDDLKEEK